MFGIRVYQHLEICWGENVIPFQARLSGPSPKMDIGPIYKVVEKFLFIP